MPTRDGRHCKATDGHAAMTSTMTYTILRYPVHLIDFVSIANGRRVTIRPMLPQDFELQLEFFRSLSARARYSRFMCSFNELPDAVAKRLGKIDYSSLSRCLRRCLRMGATRWLARRDTS